MLLRLHVRGFKNLRDTQIHFGPITCFVGPNGVGKSNVFDAIHFLCALADTDIQAAAQSVRSPHSGTFGPRDLLWRASHDATMSFEADMIVPREIVDDFGRTAKPATTLLRYKLVLRYAEGPARLELVEESLAPLKFRDVKRVVGFPHRAEFLRSVVTPTRRKGSFISTEEREGRPALMLHADGGSRGQPIPAGLSPRTVLGGTNAAEYPTVLAARREMESWRALHLEPSVMRAPDPFGGPTHVDAHGGHVAATLARLVTAEHRKGQTLAEAANRLSELVPEVVSLGIDRDEARQQLTVLARLRGCAEELGPRSLSDGTLRFLALVTMQLDTASGGVLCMEEPENGMHPSRVPAMLELLRDFVVDPTRPAGPDNPLRQVVINTHSPDVVRQLGPSEVLFVDHLDGPDGRSALVSAVTARDDWRSKAHHVPLKRMVDFIGGGPLSTRLQEQLDPEEPDLFRVHLGTAQ